MNKSKDVSNEPETDVSNIDQEPKSSPEKKSVDYHSHNKLLGQHKELRTRYDDVVGRLANLENDIQNKQEGELAKQGEHEKIIELRNQTIDQLKNQLNEVSQEKDFAYNAFLNSKKEQAVLTKLSGKITKPEYFNLLTPMLEKVAVDPETGSIDEQSATLVANQFTESFSEVIDNGKLGKTPNAAASFGVPKTEFSSLPLKDMRKEIGNAVRAAKQNLGV
jgi:hypothetical protein